jgi:hypothetical protein
LEDIVIGRRENSQHILKDIAKDLEKVLRHTSIFAGPFRSGEFVTLYFIKYCIQRIHVHQDLLIGFTSKGPVILYGGGGTKEKKGWVNKILS